MRRIALLLGIVVTLWLLPVKADAQLGCIINISCPWYTNQVYFIALDYVNRGWPPVRVIILGYGNLPWISAALGITESDARMAVETVGDIFQVRAEVARVREYAFWAHYFSDEATAATARGDSATGVYYAQISSWYSVAVVRTLAVPGEEPSFGVPGEEGPGMSGPGPGSVASNAAAQAQAAATAAFGAAGTNAVAQGLAAVSQGFADVSAQSAQAAQAAEAIGDTEGAQGHADAAVDSAAAAVGAGNAAADAAAAGVGEGMGSDGSGF